MAAEASLGPPSAEPLARGTTIGRYVVLGLVGGRLHHHLAALGVLADDVQGLACGHPKAPALPNGERLLAAVGPKHAAARVQSSNGRDARTAITMRGRRQTGPARGRVT